MGCTWPSGYALHSTKPQGLTAAATQMIISTCLTIPLPFPRISGYNTWNQQKVASGAAPNMSNQLPRTQMHQITLYQPFIKLNEYKFTIQFKGENLLYKTKSNKWVNWINSK